MPFVFALIGWLFSLYTPQSEWKRFHLRGQAQGTTYAITYYAQDSLVRQQQVDSTLQALDSSLSIYKPYSLISRFNGGEGAVVPDAHLRTVLQKAIRIHRKTRGAFDVTVLPLVQAWGFGPVKTTGLPDSAAIRSLLSCVGTSKINLRKKGLVKKDPCVQLDVNGIAQGYSVDVLASLLQSKGVEHYLVELGGEIKVKGRKQPSGDPMTIGIEAPANEEADGPMQQFIRLEEGAVTTSGNYRKFYQSGSKTISHLIDPRTGFPAQNELVSVTVWAKDAITADGFDNALMVMGLQEALSFSEKQKELEAYFIYRKNDGTIADTATKGFYKFVIP